MNTEVTDPDYPYGRAIRIECEGYKTEPYTRLIEFQGKLKTLHKSDYERLRDNILKRGFCEPISVWVYRNKPHILNGHQRLKTVKTMVENEGYLCDDLPVNYIQAKDWKQAKRKILDLTSQFGKTKAEGLLNFLKDTDITLEELVGDYTFADLNLVDWVDKYFGDSEVDDANDLGNALEVSANPGEIETVSAPTGHVRMMQMVLSTDVAEDFIAKIESLKVHYKTTNVTDTVLQAVKEIHNGNDKVKKSKKNR